jgi:copper homeostasis protein CutC
LGRIDGVLFESCVESFEAAVASAAGGAARIELCANLDVGGTTAAAALVERCVAALDIPVFAMVRPRAGSFVYSRDEAHAMARDVAAMIAAGAHGLVFGALTADGVIDEGLMQRLVDLAHPLPVTCHKAIDAARDLPEALDALLALGVPRVLTSGGAPTAADGAAMIARLVRQADEALVVMAGGGVRAGNVAALVRATGVREVHAHLLRAPQTDAETGRNTVAAFLRALPSRSAP